MLNNYKFAKDLQPGDVFYIGSVPLMYIQRLGADLGNDGVSCIRPGEKSAQKRYLRADESYQVEPRSATLTPAQQHADELVALIRAVTVGPVMHQELQNMLDKIDPPKPPTLDEALEMLTDWHRRGTGVNDRLNVADRTKMLLDRARRAGVLK